MKLLKYNLGILLCLTAIFFIACDSDDETIQQNPKPVSYTHLTLPTKLEV